jgi:hypothetical protein
MAGFVGCRDQPTGFDEVLDRILVDLGISELHRFGSGRGAEEVLTRSPINPAVHCPSFYDRAQNPDAELFRRILADSSAQIHLYLTDGVQSDLTATQSPSVNALRDWLETGRPLGVLAFRSRFAGRGWSEARKSWVGRWEVRDRPFYLYVFAPTDALLERTLSRLSSDVRGQARVMRFGDGGLRCTGAAAAIPRQASNDQGTPWLMVSATTTDKLVRQLMPMVEVTCSVREDLPLSGMRFVVDSVRYGRWTGSQFDYPLEPPQGLSFSDTVSAEPGGFRSSLRVRLAPDPATRFGYFALQLIPGRAELDPAVVGLSTNSDADVSSASRTYRFGWVVEQLLRTQVERSVPHVPFSFTVTYQ